VLCLIVRANHERKSVWGSGRGNRTYETPLLADPIGLATCQL
jgi:hypothetical protein